MTSSWSPSPNPTGVNGSEESAYGAVKAATEQIQSAPLAPNRSISAPKRAQRAAQRPTAAPVVLPPGMPPPGVVPVDAPQDYHPQLAQVWTALAAEPDASPLVKSLAAQAQQNGGNPVATS